MSASLTGQTPKNTYKQLAHFGDDGAFPEDGETPQKLYKGDGTESPVSMTATKLFVNGLEVLALTANGKLKLWNPTQSIFQYLSITGTATNEILTISNTP